MSRRELPPPLDFEPHLRMAPVWGGTKARVVLYNHQYERWFETCVPDTYYSALNVMNMHLTRFKLAMIQRQAAERNALRLRHLAERKQPR